MSISEKLGIKPIEIFGNETTMSKVDPRKVRKLEQQNADMLEMLIKQVQWDDIQHGAHDVNMVFLIEKATGKTWQEIKQLIGE